MPQLTPVWYRFADGRFTMSITKQRLKYRNLIRDDRMAVCVVSEPLAAQYATITGPAEITQDASIWPETQAIVERYVAPKKVEARMRNLRRQDRVIVSLVPERVLFRT
jgi:PPOX class probable F420-dependent enzyme